MILVSRQPKRLSILPCERYFHDRRLTGLTRCEKNSYPVGENSVSSYHVNRLYCVKALPWSYFPFGGGPRICIGMPFAQLEAKLLLATILQHYTPRTVPGYRLELNPLITLRPKHGMPMILIPTASEGDTKSWEHLLHTSSAGRYEPTERKGCLGALLSLFGATRP